MTVNCAPLSLHVVPPMPSPSLPTPLTPTYLPPQPHSMSTLLLLNTVNNPSCSKTTRYNTALRQRLVKPVVRMSILGGCCIVLSAPSKLTHEAVLVYFSYCNQAS